MLNQTEFTSQNTMSQCTIFTTDILLIIAKQRYFKQLYWALVDL